jgi:hypothetical protein
LNLNRFPHLSHLAEKKYSAIEKAAVQADNKHQETLGRRVGVGGL